MLRLLLVLIAPLGCDRADTAVPQTAPRAVADTVAVPAEVRDLVSRAREHDRADRRDSARLVYLAAADRVPEIADWLLLRAAGVTADSAERAQQYARVRTEVARDRILWTEAFARERTGDIEGAIRAYGAVGAPVSVFRLRLARASDSAARAAIRGDMFDYIATHVGAELGRDAASLFEQSFPQRSAGEELTIARTAASAGRADAAARAYAVAFRAGLGTERDRFSYASMLARADRQSEAAAQFARITEPAALAAAARYQRARMQIQTGEVGAARQTLRALIAGWPSDTSAASALLLLADLASDENRDADARAALRDAVRLFPGTPHAPAATFRAAMIAYIDGEHRTAAAEFATVPQRYPRSSDATASLYWSGRSWAAAGDRDRAEAAWRGVMARDSGTYYSVLAAERLRVPVQLGDRDPPPGAEIPELDGGLARAALLRALDMRTEERHEHDRLFRDAEQSPQRMLATAEAFAGSEQASRSIALGWRLLEAFGRGPRVYRVIYPVVERERIAQESRANGLDPVLVASLIRQESNFNPRATSPAGARGLMQIMPQVGAQIARSRGVAGYSAEMLYDPATNVTFGTAHLRGLMGSYTDVERALAAYNAGESRVARWATKRGAADPEVFTERIPFVETRGYVRAIVRNRAFYRALYSW